MIFRPTSNRRPAGFGLVELMISSSLLMVLMALVFMLYFNSHRAWKKSSEHQQVMGDMQVALAFFTEDLQATSFDSVSITPDKAAIGLLTMKDSNGDRHYGVDGRPIWDHWVLYYADNQSLFRLDVPWPAPQTTRQTPVDITAFSSQPLSSFLTGDGRVLSRNLQNFEVEIPSGSRLVNYKLTVERKGRTNQTLTLEGTVQPPQLDDSQSLTSKALSFLQKSRRYAGWGPGVAAKPGTPDKGRVARLFRNRSRNM